MSKTNELFENITKTIIEVIEAGEAGKWNKPWTSVLAGSGIGINATTKKPYTGMNQIILMAETAINAYAANEWATYRQWAGVDAQVRKGEKGTKLVRWGVTYRCSICNWKSSKGACPVKGHTNERTMWATGFTVFNADQVDGYSPKLPESIDINNSPEKVQEVEDFIAATGVNLRHVAGDRAYHMVNTNTVVVPEAAQFKTAQGYYGTVLHELTHWTGGSDRLDRDQNNSFGTERYAAEELVAELGSTFLAAQFGIEVEPHEEHAAYLASWVRMMKDTPRALYTAAKQAQAAVAFLNEKVEEKAEVPA